MSDGGESATELVSYRYASVPHTTREMMRALGHALVPALWLLASCTPNPSPVPASSDDQATAAETSSRTAVVRPGIEVFLADIPQALRGKRIGLITNNTGIDRERRLDIDLIAQSKDL